MVSLTTKKITAQIGQHIKMAFSFDGYICN